MHLPDHEPTTKKVIDPEYGARLKDQRVNNILRAIEWRHRAAKRLEAQSAKMSAGQLRDEVKELGTDPHKSFLSIDDA